MKIIFLIFLFIILFEVFISNPYLPDFDYYYFSTTSFFRYSECISAMFGKTNKTKCYANRDIKINDTLFKYDINDIISSETCFHPIKKEIFKNITELTNDTYVQNKLLLSFCIYYTINNLEKNITEISRLAKFHIASLPLEEVQHSELLFDFPDLNEFLIAGTYFIIDEEILVEKILDKNLNLKDKNNENFKLFASIYYYITTHSFNINGKAIILPFLAICNIAPHYLYKPNLNCINSSIVEEEGDKIIVKSRINIKQSEQYCFSYNISLDNDLLMLKQGDFAHNNIYDKYMINKQFSYDHNYESDELFNSLKKGNLDPNVFQYLKENSGYDVWLKFELLANNINDDLYRFGIIYFNWWKKYSHNKNNDSKHIDKQSLTFILRMCYDELNNIKNRMEIDIDEYILRTQEDNSLAELNKKLRNFTIEKVHLIDKNINFLYKNLTILNYNEIKQAKNKYIF